MTNQLFNPYEAQLWEQAKAKNSFIPLLNHPKLLYYWQRFFPKDILTIAKIQGHRIGKHEICENKCPEIQKWLVDRKTYTASSDRKLFQHNEIVLNAQDKNMLL